MKLSHASLLLVYQVVGCTVADTLSKRGDKTEGDFPLSIRYQGK